MRYLPHKFCLPCIVRPLLLQHWHYNSSTYIYYAVLGHFILSIEFPCYSVVSKVNTTAKDFQRHRYFTQIHWTSDEQFRGKVSSSTFVLWLLSLYLEYVVGFMLESIKKKISSCIRKPSKNCIQENISEDIPTVSSFPSQLWRWKNRCLFRIIYYIK